MNDRPTTPPPPGDDRPEQDLPREPGSGREGLSPQPFPHDKDAPQDPDRAPPPQRRADGDLERDAGADRGTHGVQRRRRPALGRWQQPDQERAVARAVGVSRPHGRCAGAAARSAPRP